MTQQLKACITLAEALSVAPTAHIGQLTTACDHCSRQILLRWGR